MPYHNAQFICGCGYSFSLDTMQLDTGWNKKCPQCGTIIVIELRIPSTLFLTDAVQRVEFERIHGKVK